MASSALHFSRMRQEELAATAVILEISCTFNQSRELEDLEKLNQAGFLTFSCSGSSLTAPDGQSLGTERLHYWTRWPGTSKILNDRTRRNREAG